MPNRNIEWLADVKEKRLTGEVETPEHILPTTYRYNSLNQVVSQQSPDGGLSKFWYDRLGRLVVSRNAKQAVDDWYSYTRYDHLGRITEVGEKKQSNPMTDVLSRNESDLQTWLNTNYIENGSTYRARQVVQTVYDVMSPVITPGLELYPRFHQKAHTLRNRVSFTRHYDKLLVSEGTVQYSQYNSASHYSYDIHGNVDTLLQDYAMGLMAAHGSYSQSANNRFKLIAYHYDLVSGKVNQVHYQPDEQDALYHRYEYDAENRLTDVYTTTVKEFVGFPSLEEREAHYQYYLHGPLARTVLGQQQVQGIDYAYTLQGWLKGVNSTSLQPQYDMGNDAMDGSPNALVGKDVFGFQLNYYTGSHGDYTAINSVKNPFPRHAAFMPTNENKELYNGNISSMVVTIPKLGGPQLYNYKYDQLNRIIAMDTYIGLDVVNNTWNNDNQELVTEQHLYGSSRLGIWNREVDMDNAPSNSSNESLVGTTWLTNFSRGKKFFELTNHLGNVMVTISDRKTLLQWDESVNNGECLPGSALEVLEVDLRGTELSYVAKTEVNLLPGFESGENDEFEVYTDNTMDVCVPQSGGGGGTDPFYAAEVVSANDYYPGGMLMPGRNASVASYRYGFNGQEKSTDINSDGNLYTAQFWEYDSRLGRRWNLDPKPNISFSPYNAFAGNPIFNSDPLGDTTVPQGDWYRRQAGKNITYKYAAGSDKEKLDANSKIWWKIPEANRNRVVTFGKDFAPTEVQSSIDLHADGTFSVLKSDIREGSVEGHIKWHINLPNGGNVYVVARDYMQSKGVGDGSFWGAAGTLAGDKVVKVGGAVISKLASQGGYSTIYRAVSQAEVDDIAKFGFRMKPGGYETGKLFAPTLQ